MSKRTALGIGILLLLYALPLVVYIYTFGTELTNSHTRWAEFGSALSGIYAPIVAITTLVVLFAQVMLQKQINEHQYVQSHIEQARADLEFYCVQLAEALDQTLLPGQTVRQVLHQNFQPSSLAALDDDSLRALASNIHANAPTALALWFAIYPILAGLIAGKSAPFEMTLHSSVAKLIAMLSFETCIALDNYHRTRTEGRMSTPYRFSPLLSEAA
ncbi:hypothetical protein [Thiobacillus sp.]|uniref:hypothetical protein n=1 Tax=Thiobacillus sp. TaxID=924 RepID=UPI00183D8738|nr:hypothetical protein [Thiobacillus sp.]MBC2731095.1 hypothetical protein [Thiobacillus sp.]MBC2739832.1 hypothetical protein [Thiobacillus sp.]MBC2758828.1 hypothetical protein [Thiobacillus sp.]